MQGKSASYDISQAFDPAASVFVSANAGAGKTSLLTNRVLALLLHGVPPSKILCLTFTNATAAEMDNRILNELGAWVMADEKKLSESLAALTGHAPTKTAMSRARSLFAQVLEAPEGIRIQTIHGFCQSLLRRFPIEAGVSPHFTVMDGRTEQELLQEARLRLFGRAQTEDPLLQQGLSAMAHMLGEAAFHALVAEMIQNKRRMHTLLARSGGVDAAIATLRTLLQVPHGGTLPALLESHFSYDETTLAKWRVIVKKLLHGSEAEQETAQLLIRWFSESNSRESQVAEYIHIFLTKDKKPRVRVVKKATIDEADLVEILQAEQRRVWDFNDAWSALKVAENTVHLLHVGEALLALYGALKNAYALMDYDDLVMSACALLQKPGIAPWVLYKLDGGIDHILVDEAQDTSPEQWAIISALTQEFFAGAGRAEQERSLFLVGDEKQSIYSFQGADPMALSRMQQQFSRDILAARKQVHSIRLTHSFRSTGEILSAVDAIFAQENARAGLMFSDAELSHIATRDAPGLVEIWPLTEPPEDENDMAVSTATRLARFIAAHIADWIASGTILESKNRAVQAGDIMILVRSRTSLVDRMVRALKRANVPVAGHDRMTLSDNLAVQDLIALGQCLLLPEDNLTLASLLKSPICNVGEEDLFRIAAGRGDVTLWQRLSLDGALAAVYALLTDLRARADFVSPFDLYSYALDTLGARRRFTGRMGEEYNDPIDEFLGQALLYERSHTPSLQGFLHWLSASDSEIKRDMEQRKNCVRIMTVHGAKGLQAPIVILPDTVELPRMQDTLLWYNADGVALPLWPVSAARDDAFCAGVRDAQRQNMYAEYRRLFYVALTRAEDRLYICGHTNKEKINEQCWYSLAKSGLAPLAAEFDMKEGKGLRMGAHPVRAQRGAGSDAVRDPAQPLRVSQDEFDFLTRNVPAEPSPPQPLAPSRPAEDEPPAASPLAENHVYQRGTLIHKLLQYLPEAAPAERSRLAAAIAAPYRRTMENETVEECIAQTFSVIDHPDFAFLFARGSLAEVPVAGVVTLDGRQVAVSGQIDRLHIGANEVWIVDFKSNRTPPQAVPRRYIRQMRLYRALLSHIYPEKRIRCALLWTAAPAIAQLDESLLDEPPASSYI